MKYASPLSTIDWLSIFGTRENTLYTIGHQMTRRINLLKNSSVGIETRESYTSEHSEEDQERGIKTRHTHCITIRRVRCWIGEGADIVSLDCRSGLLWAT